MSIIILSESIGKVPKRYKWTGVTVNGKLTDGYGDSREECKKEADLIGEMKEYFCDNAPAEPIEFCGVCGGVRGVPPGIHKCICK